MTNSEGFEKLIQVSLDGFDFKEWMSTQESSNLAMNRKQNTDLIGITVESKISVKKLVEEMEPFGETSVHDLAAEFRENGGVIKEINGSSFLIEVNNGCFEINRCFVRKV